MEALLECCCGIDVHRDTLQVCILKGLTDNPEIIRAEFKTMQQDLQELVQWLIYHDALGQAYHLEMMKAPVKLSLGISCTVIHI